MTAWEAEKLAEGLTAEEYEEQQTRRIRLKAEETGEVDAWEYDLMESKGIW